MATILLSCSGCWLDDDASALRRTTDSPAAAPNPATTGAASGGLSANKIQPFARQGSPALRFNNTEFVLVTQDDLVNQYVPVGQTLDNWEEMFALRQFPELNSPAEAIANVVDSLDQNKDWFKAVTSSSRPELEQAIDFVIWNDDKSLTEFNIHIYRKDPSGQGLISNMYLMRGYGMDGHENLIRTVGQSRQTIVDSIMDSGFPVFIEPQGQRR